MFLCVLGNSKKNDNCYCMMRDWSQTAQVEISLLISDTPTLNYIHKNWDRLQIGIIFFLDSPDGSGSSTGYCLLGPLSGSYFC